MTDSGLYAKGRVTGFQRAKRNQRTNTSLVQVEGVADAKEAQWYLGKVRRTLLLRFEWSLGLDGGWKRRCEVVRMLGRRPSGAGGWRARCCRAVCCEVDGLPQERASAKQAASREDDGHSSS